MEIGQQASYLGAFIQIVLKDSDILAAFGSFKIDVLDGKMSLINSYKGGEYHSVAVADTFHHRTRKYITLRHVFHQHHEVARHWWQAYIYPGEFAGINIDNGPKYSKSVLSIRT